MSNTTCGGTDSDNDRDESAALVLKLIAIGSILIAGVVGIAIPLVGKQCRFLRTDSNLFVAAKAFAAGVILATGFVHMLSAATNALSDPCLPTNPWSKFPFAGFFAMMASLITLLVDFLGTQYYERKQASEEQQVRVGSAESDAGLEYGILPVEEVKERNGKVFGEEEGGGMHIVGMHAHAAHHRHSHPQGQDACDGHVKDHSDGHGHGHGHAHSHGLEDDDGEEGGVRHVVVSQVIFPLFSVFFRLGLINLFKSSLKEIISVFFLAKRKS